MLPLTILPKCFIWAVNEQLGFLCCKCSILVYIRFSQAKFLFTLLITEQLMLLIMFMLFCTIPYPRDLNDQNFQIWPNISSKIKNSVQAWHSPTEFLLMCLKQHYATTKIIEKVHLLIYRFYFQIRLDTNNNINNCK